MALCIILIFLGAGYTALTESPASVRQFELTALWVTLGLIAIAAFTKAPLVLTFPFVVLLAAPLWYLTHRVSAAKTRSDRANRARRSSRSRTITGAYKTADTLDTSDTSDTSDGSYTSNNSNTSKIADAGAKPESVALVRQTNPAPHPALHADLIEEIEITAVPEGLRKDPLINPATPKTTLRVLQLAPVESRTANRSRRV